MTTHHREMAGSPSHQESATEQEKATQAYKARFDKLVSSAHSDLAKYNEMVTGGEFEDKEGEEEGGGEKRKLEMQERMKKVLKSAQKMYAVIESGEPIPLIQGEISAEYSYTNPQTNKVEIQETINLNIEEKLQEFMELYKETGIDIPADFEDQIKEIWSRNGSEIQQAIEEKGFDDILLVPADINLAELAEKMKMENGNCTGSNFDAGGGFAGAKSVGTDKPRIILYHKKTLPEIQEKMGIDVHIEITAGDAEKLFKKNPDQYLSTLEDLIIFERKNLKDSNTHFSKYTEKSGVWLSGTKSGDRFVYSFWDSDGRLAVVAFDADFSDAVLGVRPSRYFS